MRYHVKTGIFLFALLFTGIVAFAQAESNPDKTKNMNDYILLIRLPLQYGPEEAATARPRWNALTDQWKADGIFVTSFVFPREGYVVSGNDKVAKEQVVSHNLRMISSIIVKAVDIEAAVSLAKKCPILEQGGTVEVREVQPR